MFAAVQVIADQVRDQDDGQQQTERLGIDTEQQLGAEETADDRKGRYRPVFTPCGPPVPFRQDADQVDGYRRDQGQQDRGLQLEAERQQGCGQ